MTTEATAKKPPGTNRVGLAIVVGICVIGFVALSGRQGPSDRTKLGQEVLGAVRSTGYLCPEFFDMEKTEVRSNGTRVYRIACGPRGPYYQLSIEASGLQLIRPLN